MLACLNAAIQLAFFVLLRSSEYCVVPLARNGAFDPDSTLLDGDVMLICRGRMVPWDEVEEDDYPHVSEVVISIKKSRSASPAAQSELGRPCAPWKQSSVLSAYDWRQA